MVLPKTEGLEKHLARGRSTSGSSKLTVLQDPAPSGPAPAQPHPSSEPAPPCAATAGLLFHSTPLPVFALLTGRLELPSVCIGVSPGRPAKSVLFHTVRFGALSCWLGEMSTGGESRRLWDG